MWDNWTSPDSGNSSVSFEDDLSCIYSPNHMHKVCSELSVCFSATRDTSKNNALYVKNISIN